MLPNSLWVIVIGMFLFFSNLWSIFIVWYYFVLFYCLKKLDKRRAIKHNLLIHKTFKPIILPVKLLFIRHQRPSSGNGMKYWMTSCLWAPSKDLANDNKSFKSIFSASLLFFLHLYVCSNEDRLPRKKIFCV